MEVEVQHSDDDINGDLLMRITQNANQFDNESYGKVSETQVVEGTGGGFRVG